MPSSSAGASSGGSVQPPGGTAPVSPAPGANTGDPIDFTTPGGEATPVAGGAVVDPAEAAVAEQGEADATGDRRSDATHATASLPFVGELAPLEIIAPTLALLPLEQPLRIPLLAPRLRITFAAPTSLDTSALRMANGAQPPPAEEIATSRADAFRQYAAAVQVVRQQHERSEQSSNRTIEALAGGYERARDRIPAQLDQTDAALDTIFEQADVNAGSAAADADYKIVEEFVTSRRLLNRTLSSARGSVAANARTAQTQIDTIIADLSSAFVNTLSAAATACESTSLRADTALRSWKSRINTLFDPLNGSGTTQARNEVARRAAPGIVDAAIADLATRTTQITGSLSTSITETQTSVRSSVGPSLQAHASKIGTDGQASVTKAFSAALTELQKHANDARKATAQMRADVVEQLTGRHVAARATIQSEAQRAMVDAHRTASTGVQTLNVAGARTLPLYAQSAQRLGKSLADAAASGGPQALQKTAPRAAASVISMASGAQATQARQTDSVRTGVLAGLEQRQEQAEEAYRDHEPVVEQDVAAIVSDAVMAQSSTAESTSRGFTGVADGVRQAAQSWSTPLAATFGEYISTSRTSLMENYPPFQTQVNTSRDEFIAYVRPRLTPDSLLHRPIERAWSPVYDSLVQRRSRLVNALSAGIIDTVDEGGVTGALRGLTRAQGVAMRAIWRRGDLDTLLALKLGTDSDDYRAAINYLDGNAVAGARYELRASIHWYNDEESRIEATLRALSPEQIRELHNLEGGASTLADVRDALGGTDLQVFDALSAGNHARADAYRMRERIDEARRSGNNDALNTVLAEYSRAPSPEQFGGQELSEAERRASVQREFAHIQGMVDLDRGGEISQQDASQSLFGYATRDIEVVRSAGEGQTYTETLQVLGPHRDLSQALIFQGEQSVDARAARLGVEVQRSGGPNIVNVDQALVDPRLNPGSNVSDEDRATARAEREQVLQRFASSYGGAASGVSVADAQATAITSLRGRFGSELRSADLAEALVRDEYPTPRTASIAMEVAIHGVGTNTDLIDRTLGRMNRTEIAQMRQHYDAFGADLYEDLGVFGHSSFGDVSGDDRLRVERLLLGVPRNDRERAEVGAFTIQQQRSETGVVGGWLASGSLQKAELDDSERELGELSGGSVRFGADGQPTWAGTPNFIRGGERDGEYTGSNFAEFGGAALDAQLTAQNYAAKIDQYANFAATSIAVLGAIAAAVATVATGGAASPLLLAAIAGVTGLTSMATQRLISGGRYGWERAAVDLGMTAVDALTAGVGQGLGLAARGGMPALRAGMSGGAAALRAGGRATMRSGLRAGLRTGMRTELGMARRLAVRQVGGRAVLGDMGRLTGSAFMDKVLIGMATGSLGAVGRTALDERTYKQGAGGAMEELFAGLLRGALTGGVTAAASNAFEELPISRVRDINNRLPTIGSRVGQSTNVIGRGVGQGFSSAIGAGAGGTAGAFFDVGRGKTVDAGDAFVSISASTLQSLAQGTGEGSASARAQAGFNRRYADRAPRPGGAGEPAVRIAPIADMTAAPARPSESEAPRIQAPERLPVAPEAAPPPRPPVEATSPAAPPRPAMPEVAPLPRPTPMIESAPPPRVVAPEAAAPTNPEATAPRPAPVVGEAAGIPGSQFRGDILPGPRYSLVTDAVETAARRLTNSDSPLAGAARIPGGEPNRVIVRTVSGEEVGIHLSVVDPATMPRDPDGPTPVARFSHDPGTGEYTVQVSARARPEMVERALAHELAEIRATHRAQSLPDALRPGGHGARPLAPGTTPELSPHDRGRLAELEVLARQIGEARQSGHSARAAQLGDEAQRLVAHMGLAGDSEASAARRGLATDGLPAASPARALIGEAVAGAATNPFLQRRPADVGDDLDLLARQLDHARTLGDGALAAQVLDLARRRLISDVGGLVTPTRTERAGSVIRERALLPLATAGGPRAALLQETLPLVRATPAVETGPTPRDPSALDPHQSEAVRQQFGDRPQFQDWPAFRDRFFAARSTYDPNAPRDLGLAFARWSSGDYVGPEGSLRSLAAATRRPDPGFEARFAETPTAQAAARPAAEATLPRGGTVADAVAGRQQLGDERRGLYREYDDPATTSARRLEIEDRDRQIGALINAHSEHLGEAAGRRFASLQPGGLSEIALPRAGAGLPDLVFEGPGGRLILIETKGGTSELGVRRSADGTRLVQQGTYAYLESLGTSMARSSDPEISRLGNRILTALDGTPPNLDYILVRQPFHADGSLAAPEVGRFDLHGGPGRTPSASPGRSGTASAVGQSGFRGDSLPRPMPARSPS